MENNASIPILIPLEQEKFWMQIREIIRDEVSKAEKYKRENTSYETPGLTYKPLYKITEVCTFSGSPGPPYTIG